MAGNPVWKDLESKQWTESIEPGVLGKGIDFDVDPRWLVRCLDVSIKLRPAECIVQMVGGRQLALTLACQGTAVASGVLLLEPSEGQPETSDLFPVTSLDIEDGPRAFALGPLHLWIATPTGAPFPWDRAVEVVLTLRYIPVLPSPHR